MLEMIKVSALREENVSYMNSILPVQESFDLIQRDIYVGERPATFYFIDGFTKDEVMLKIIDGIMKVKKEDMPVDATQFARKCLPYIEVDIIEDFDQILRNILSGVTCMFIDGYEAAIAIQGHILPEVWKNQQRISRFEDPEMGLWKPLYLTQL